MPLIAEKGRASSSGHQAGAEPGEVSSSVLPSQPTTSSPSRLSLPGAAVLTEMGSLILCIPLSSEPSVFAKEQPAHSEVQAVAGTSATLSCEVAQAQTEVTWYKDGKKLSSSSKVRVEAKGCTRKLVVQQAGKADAGEYSCEAGGQKVSFHLDVTGQFGGSKLALCGGDGTGLHP